MKRAAVSQQNTWNTETAMTINRVGLYAVENNHANVIKGKVSYWSAFDHGQIVGARHAGCLASASAGLVIFLRQSIASLYQDYAKSGKTSNQQKKYGCKRATDCRGERRPSRIVIMYWTATLKQITSEFDESFFSKDYLSNHDIKRLWQWTTTSCTLIHCKVP